MNAYCGRCYWDRGQMVPLTLMQARVSLSKSQWIDGGTHGTPKPYGCSYCGEERHDGGSHLRAHIVTGGDHKGEENVVRIPHIVVL